MVRTNASVKNMTELEAIAHRKLLDRNRRRRHYLKKKGLSEPEQINTDDITKKLDMLLKIHSEHKSSNKPIKICSDTSETSDSDSKTSDSDSEPSDSDSESIDSDSESSIEPPKKPFYRQVEPPKKTLYRPSIIFV